MKKFLIGLLVGGLILGISGMAFGQSSDATTFNLSMTVDKYIESIPTVNWDFGTTVHNGWGGGNPKEGLNTALPEGSGWGQWDLAYANCGFSVTVSGSNPAGQNVPRFARAEVGTHANGFDILSTGYQIGILTNGVWDNHLGLNSGIRAGSFPKTVNLTETPHNGQVAMKMAAKINAIGQGSEENHGYPIRQTLIDPTFTWDQSADAGVYTCTMLVTLNAL